MNRGDNHEPVQCFPRWPHFGCASLERPEHLARRGLETMARDRAQLTHVLCSRQSDSLGVVPPVVWDFEPERLVEIPQEDYSVERHESGEPGEPSFDVMLAKERSETKPLWT